MYNKTTRYVIVKSTLPVGCRKAEKRISKLPKQLYAKSPKGLFQKQQALVKGSRMAYFDQKQN